MHRHYCHSDFTRFRKLHTSVAPAVVWKRSYSGCDLKLCDFIARLCTSIPDPGNHIYLHCKRYYRDSLTHQLKVKECKCTKPLKDRFLCECRGILPPELVDVSLSADADTFVTIVLSASCWSNLDRAMVDSFLLKAYAAISNAHLSRVWKRVKLSESCLSTIYGFGSTEISDNFMLYWCSDIFLTK